MVEVCDNMDKFNLSLDAEEYTNHVQKTFHEMFKHQDLADITIICDDKNHFKAHKIVLSSWSPVFKSIISTLPSLGATVYLRGVKSREMETLLEFMYLGQANCFQDKIENVLAVAKNLEIKGLSENDSVANDGEGSVVGEEDADDNEELSIEYQATEDSENVNKKIKQESKSDEYEKDKLNVGFICKHCNYIGKDQFKLNRHTQSVHNNERFKCQFCDKILSRKDKLTEHMRRMHSDLNSI